MLLFAFTTTLFFCKNVVSPAQAKYSYFSANFRLKIFFRDRSFFKGYGGGGRGGAGGI